MNIPLPTETPMAEMDSEYLLDVFKAPNQLSKLIWGLNSENFDQYTDQIINLIKTQNVPPQMAFHFINIVAEFKSKQISLYSDLYQRILNEFSLNIKPDCSQLAILLYDKGFHDFLSEPPTSEEIHKILNPYEENTVNFYIASDRVDMIEPKFSDIPLNGKKMKDPPLDVAIINGSELCFNYFRNKGAKYTDSSRVNAIIGGSKHIMSVMENDGISFDSLRTLLNRHYYDMADYLITNKGQVFYSIVESMYYGNFGITSYLLDNCEDINAVFVHQFLRPLMDTLFNFCLCISLI